jgi:peroxiredoxin
MSGHAQSPKLTGGPEMGIGTGEKAPSFRLKDQFGREQSNDTLRGTNGTVLLFFRSADW